MSHAQLSLTSNLFTVSIIELNVGIITSCMPPLQVLIRKLTGTITNSLRSFSHPSSSRRSGRKTPKGSNPSGDSARLTDPDTMEMKGTNRSEPMEDKGVQAGLDSHHHLQWPSRPNRGDDDDRHQIRHTVDIEVSRS